MVFLCFEIVEIEYSELLILIMMDRTQGLYRLSRREKDIYICTEDLPQLELADTTNIERERC